MSETFVNVYSGYTGYPACKSAPHESAAEAQRWANFEPDFSRVQKMYLAGTWWHRPPVGMRADQASHLWVATVKISGDEIIGMGEKLVPRK